MIKVYTSSVIDAPADRVWAHIRDFNALPSWVPAVADSRIEGGAPADKVGCVRNFNLKDGGHLREQLLALSDRDRSVTYNILVSPMGVEDYVATLKLTAITDGDRTRAGTDQRDRQRGIPGRLRQPQASAWSALIGIPRRSQAAALLASASFRIARNTYGRMPPLR
jgi:hypothetical protein